jgi:hypothetical protein
MIYLVVMVAVIIVYLAVSSVILRKLRMMVGAINFPTRKLRAVRAQALLSIRERQPLTQRRYFLLYCAI